MENKFFNVAIIGAVETEVNYLKSRLENCKIYEYAGFKYYIGFINNFKLIVVKCGIGKVSAAICAQIAIDKFSPNLIINIGCAGALNKNLKVGDIIVANSLVEHDMDVVGLGSERGYIQELDMVNIEPDTNDFEFVSSKLKNISKNVYEGLVISGDTFVYMPKQKESLRQLFPGVMCCDMESASIAHCCKQNNIDFLIIRTISDTAEGDSSVDYYTFSAKVGKMMAKCIYETYKSL